MRAFDTILPGARSTAIRVGSGLPGAMSMAPGPVGRHDHPMNTNKSGMSDEEANVMSRARWNGLDAVRQDGEYWVGVGNSSRLEPSDAPGADVRAPKVKGRSKVSWEDAFADADRNERRTKTKIGH